MVNQIDKQTEQLTKLVGRIPAVQIAFQKAAQGDYDAPEVKAVLSFEGITAQDKLRALSQERADIIFGEIEDSLDIAETSMDRARLLLRARKPIYNDAQVELCVQDIYAHMDQSHFHATRAYGFLPSLRSHNFLDQTIRLLNVTSRFSNITYDREHVERGVKQCVESGPMTEDEVQKFYVNAPPVPADIPAAYTAMSFNLAGQNISAANAALNRIENTVRYLYLIDQDLVPKNLGDPADWAAQKDSLVGEGTNTLNQIIALTQRGQNYFQEAALRAIHAPRKI